MSSTYIDFNVENNSKNPKFEDGDDAKMLKYNNIFAGDYTANWSEEVFMIKLKILFHGHMLLVYLRVKKFLENFIEKNCIRLIKQSLESKK